MKTKEEIEEKFIEDFKSLIPKKRTKTVEEAFEIALGFREEEKDADRVRDKEWI